tara:strand:- start:736 stop:1266 length:531 start_codon:yes stop_codon:yes gene_type:complete
MKEERIKNKLEVILLTGIFLLSMFGLSPNAYGDELTQKFKNPSFSGIGTSAHYLTIENQEKTRRDKIKEDIEAALLAAERAEENTVLAKFIRNLESRIYSQLSKQLVESLFSNEDGASFGSFTLEDSVITYERRTCIVGVDAGCTEGQEIIVLNITNSDGTTTTISIPIGVGNWGG